MEDNGALPLEDAVGKTKGNGGSRKRKTMDSKKKVPVTKRQRLSVTTNALGKQSCIEMVALLKSRFVAEHPDSMIPEIRIQVKAGKSAWTNLLTAMKHNTSWDSSDMYERREYIYSKSSCDFICEIKYRKGSDATELPQHFDRQTVSVVPMDIGVIIATVVKKIETAESEGSKVINVSPLHCVRLAFGSVFQSGSWSYNMYEVWEGSTLEEAERKKRDGTTPSHEIAICCMDEVYLKERSPMHISHSVFLKTGEVQKCMADC